jgi:hypothetical protein
VQQPFLSPCVQASLQPAHSLPSAQAQASPQAVVQAQASPQQSHTHAAAAALAVQPAQASPSAQAHASPHSDVQAHSSPQQEHEHALAGAVGTAKPAKGRSNKVRAIIRDVFMRRFSRVSIRLGWSPDTIRVPQGSDWNRLRRSTKKNAVQHMEGMGRCGRVRGWKTDHNRVRRCGVDSYLRNCAAEGKGLRRIRLRRLKYFVRGAATIVLLQEVAASLRCFRNRNLGDCTAALGFGLRGLSFLTSAKSRHQSWSKGQKPCQEQTTAYNSRAVETHLSGPNLHRVYHKSVSPVTSPG